MPLLNTHTHRPLAYFSPWPVIFIVLALPLCALLYWPGLSGPLLLDDFSNLLSYLTLDIDNWRIHWPDHLVSDSGPLGRPIASLSFMFDAVTHGNDFWYWKYQNLLLHLLNGLLVFFLAQQLFSLARRQTDNVSASLALLCALLWLFHPLHVSTVLYTVQRMTLLASFFTLLGLISYIIGRYQCSADKTSLSPPRWRWLIFSYAVCLPLASFSKESGALLLLFLFLLEAVVFAPLDPNKRRKRALLLALLLPLFAGSLYYLTHWQTLILHGYAIRDFTFGERLLTQSRVVWLYIKLSLTPNLSGMGFFHDDLAYSRSLFYPLSTFFSVLGLVGLAGIALWQRQKRPVLSLALCLFFASQLLESTVFPLEIMFEHRTYLASFFILMAFVLAIQALPLKQKKTTRLPKLIPGLILGLMLCLFSFLSWNRVQIWTSFSGIQQQAFYAHPTSPRVLVEQMAIYARTGDFTRAYRLVESMPASAQPMMTMYLQCRSQQSVSSDFMRRSYPQAEPYIAMYTTNGFIDIASMKRDGQCRIDSHAFASLLTRVLSATAMKPGNRQSLSLLIAELQHANHQLDQAIATLEQGFQYAPINPVLLFQATEWLLDAGQYDRAREIFSRAVQTALIDQPSIRQFKEGIDHRFNKEAPPSHKADSPANAATTPSRVSSDGSATH